MAGHRRERTFALVSPLEALLDNHTRTSDTAAAHDPTLVAIDRKRISVSELHNLTQRGRHSLEVGQDDVDSLAFLAEQVLDGNLDVVERDVSGSSSGRVCVVWARAQQQSTSATRVH